MAKAASATKKTAPKTTSLPKKEVISKFQEHGKDTGSSKVQVAILTHRIATLADHLQTHKKDKHSRRGLIGMVGKRRRLLRHLQLNDPKSYTTVIKELGLRK